MSKKNKRNNKEITEKLTQELDNDNEPVSEPETAEPQAPGEAPEPAPVQNEMFPEQNETLELIQTLQSMDSSLDGYEYRAVDEEEEEEAPEEPAEEVKSAPRPNKFYLVFAVFIIAMSIIGIISTVRFISSKIEDIVDQTSLKNEIALFIYPLVTVDPPEFSNPSEIPQNVVIESALWKIILTGDNSNYEKLYSTYMYVPAVDVEFAARNLFGSEAVIVHQTVGNVGSAFTYDESLNSYLVPISPRYTYYSPSVRSISNVGELYTVRVEYMPPTALAVEGINLQNSSNKIMEYTLSMSKNNKTIRSVRNTANLGDVHAY